MSIRVKELWDGKTGPALLLMPMTLVQIKHITCISDLGQIIASQPVLHIVVNSGAIVVSSLINVLGWLLNEVLPRSPFKTINGPPHPFISGPF